MSTRIEQQDAPAAVIPHLVAPLNPHGQCFGLIPEKGDWLDDIIDWKNRQFHRSEDALRMAACWNLLARVPTSELLDPRSQHPDDTAVDRFADAMKTAMATARAQGKEGWHDKLCCNETHLRSLMRVALSKGNPVHVGNYAMMLFNRGERTADAMAHAVRTDLARSNMQGLLQAVAPAGFADAVKYLTRAFDALEATTDSDLDHFEDEEEEAEAAPTQFAARKIAQALELLYGYGLEVAAGQAVPEREPYARRAPLKACEHDWPGDESGTDLEGDCKKCGMAFQYMIHMEMP